MIILSLHIRENERILLFVRLNSAEHKSTSVDLSSDRQGLPLRCVNALVLDSLFGKFRTNLAALLCNTWRLSISVWIHTNHANFNKDFVSTDLTSRPLDVIDTTYSL